MGKRGSNENPARFDNLPPEKRAEYGRKGGINAAENRRKRKEMRAILEIFCDMPMKKGKVADIEQIKNFMDIKGKNITTMEALGVQLFQKALRGDLNAVGMILALLGQKPSENVSIDAKVTKNPLQELSADELRKLIKEHDDSNQ